MTNSAKDKGDRGEREAEALLKELFDLPVRRQLGAGRRDDVGDLDQVPCTAVQVAWRENLSATVTRKLPEVEQQRRNRRVPFSALLLRRTRVREHQWIVVLSLEMWAKLTKYAVIGFRAERAMTRRS